MNNDKYTCSDCKYYEKRKCYLVPNKSVTLWGTEKPCSKFELKTKGDK